VTADDAATSASLSEPAPDDASDPAVDPAVEPAAVRADADRVSVTIAAPADAVWDLVADVTRMGEWSPECYRCRWIGARREPVVGARFVGFNRRGWARWFTTNEVVAAERGHEFAFRTQGTNVRWGYRFTPAADGAGTVLTETRDLSGGRAWLVRLFGPFVGGADRHADELRAGMRRTLERVKATAEAG
jgi:dimethylaniline monooxygenase (N-oxide forming)